MKFNVNDRVCVQFDATIVDAPKQGAMLVDDMRGYRFIIPIPSALFKVTLVEHGAQMGVGEPPKSFDSSHGCGIAAGATTPNASVAGGLVPPGLVKTRAQLETITRWTDILRLLEAGRTGAAVERLVSVDATDDLDIIKAVIRNRAVARGGVPYDAK